jgi:hydrogenase nickel insertion protein HypA
MHELSLVESVKAIVLRHSRAERASRIVSVRIAVGGLSGYIEEALGMFWEEVSRDTEAAGARLEFLHIPGQLLCLQCSKSFAAGSADDRCPDCVSVWVKSLAGDVCYVDSIEVETGDSA